MAFAIASFAACGGQVASVSDGAEVSDAGTKTADGGGNTGANGSGSGSGSGSGAKDASSTTSPLCPTDVPSGACGKEGLVCEYGTDYAFECNTLARCEKGEWSVTQNDCTTSSDPSGCPTDESSIVSGTACDPPGKQCVYDDAHCSCESDHTGVPYQWNCYENTGECPIPRPHLGTVCTDIGRTCDYATCGNSITCTPDGIWQVGQGGCHP